MANARIAPFTVINPGGLGLNKQAGGTLLDPQWCLEATNCVFDDSNRLSSRLGWASVTSTPISGTPAIGQMFEYKPLSGANTIISAAQHKLYKGTTAPTDITGALTPSADNWQFANFNGNVYGLQTSHPLVQWTGAGNFTATAAASGSVPTGNILMGAYGRLWGVNSDNQTVVYSALLDATKWAAVDGGGSINMLSVWPTNDQVTAIAAFNGRLIIFGNNNIVIYGDNVGSIIGVNPNNLTVVDAISGTGCIARDSVRSVAGQDLVFLSNNGLTSLNRILIQRSNPLRDISANVRDYLKNVVNTQTNLGNIRSAFVPRYGIYLLVFPDVQSVFCFDTKKVLQDGTWRVTEWTGLIPTSLVALEDGVTLYQGALGRALQYSNHSDNGNSYQMKYLSGWLDLGDEVNNYLKALKRISAILFLSGTVDIDFLWAFDFSSTLNEYTRSSAFLQGYLYNSQVANAVAEYANDLSQALYGSSIGLNEYDIPAFGAGQFFQLGIAVTVNSAQVAIQQMQAFAKVGRYF